MLADIREDVHEPDELAGQLGENLAERVFVALAERPVCVFAHRDVVVDVDDFPAEAVGEIPGHEEREITKAAKAGPLLETARLQRASQADGERLALVPERSLRLGAHVAAEEIDEIIGSKLVRAQVLTLERGLDQILEVLGWRLLQERIVHPYLLADDETAKRIPVRRRDATRRFVRDFGPIIRGRRRIAI